MINSVSDATRPAAEGIGKPRNSLPPPLVLIAARSEERRVGKECRSRCDWSSDVCSSDLVQMNDQQRERRDEAGGGRDREAEEFLAAAAGAHRGEIGRASCRERV